MIQYIYVDGYLGQEVFQSVEFFRYLLLADSWLYLFSYKVHIHEGVDSRSEVPEGRGGDYAEKSRGEVSWVGSGVGKLIG